jgi:hypothetical protein
VPPTRRRAGPPWPFAIAHLRRISGSDNTRPARAARRSGGSAIDLTRAQLTDAEPRLARLYIAFGDTDVIDADEGTGVALTAGGWNGRLIEYRSVFGRLRDVPEPVSVADLGAAGITVVSIDRDAPVPLPGGLVHADGGLRPRLWAGRPVLPVQRDEAGGWFAPGPRTIGDAEHERADAPVEVEAPGA